MSEKELSHAAASWPVDIRKVMGVDSDGPSTSVVEFAVDDIDDLDALFEELRGIPDLAVEAVPAPIVAGEQGSALDFLTVACSSGGAIAVLLQLVRSMVESRGPKFSLRVRSGKDRIEINAENVEEMLPVLKELLGDP